MSRIVYGAAVASCICVTALAVQGVRGPALWVPALIAGAAAVFVLVTNRDLA